MEDVRQLARKAAQLQFIADQYRERARRGAPDGWSLELQAAMLERIAAGLLTLGTVDRSGALA